MNSKTKLTVLLVCLVLLLSGCGASGVLHTGTGSEQTVEASRVPWDYRIQEATVGDLVGSDMTLLPDNELLPNDGNYATGDTIWILQFMDAELTTDESQKNEIRLSAWSTLKSYSDQFSAEKDLAELKVAVTTEVGLVGVYKTEYNGDTRNFAVLELPTGNRVKQPVDDARYEQLKSAQEVAVVLEEVHDFADYDLTYAKFRGWANP
ncbi:hypothetical protein [Paenibacillus brevis]|uniref:Signal peptide protein n=1 Tax=Paenibacillus brevis TaxID=2841508 RepID=A0ABS6FU49_9BACL|nr:hypothetical protein [Paenibacillus brevis]MBU5673451.1 signal peptide protein [Paenibacillus brevis]